MYFLLFKFCGFLFVQEKNLKRNDLIKLDYLSSFIHNTAKTNHIKWINIKEDQDSNSKYVENVTAITTFTSCMYFYEKAEDLLFLEP